MSKAKKKDRRPLYLKFRVRATEPMQAGDLLVKLKHAIRTRRVPKGIEILYMDWEKGVGRKLNSGSIDGDMLDDLRRFYGALRAGTARVRKPE